MRSDELSRKMFLAGCCGLPWLWIVHTLYFFNKVGEEDDNDETNSDAGLLQADGTPVPPSSRGGDAAPPLTEEEKYQIYVAERTWVFRCRNAAMIVVTTWLAWIIFCQILAVNILPTFLYVRNPDQGEFTGW